MSYAPGDAAAAASSDVLTTHGLAESVRGTSAWRVAHARRLRPRRACRGGRRAHGAAALRARRGRADANARTPDAGARTLLHLAAAAERPAAVRALLAAGARTVRERESERGHLRRAARAALEAAEGVRMD